MPYRTLSDRRDVLTSYLKNSFVWLREGVRVLMVLPLSVLGRVEILSERVVGRMKESRLWIVIWPGNPDRFFEGCHGFALGWNSFIQLVTGWWGSFL